MALIEGLRGHIEDGNTFVSISQEHFHWLPGRQPKVCQARGCEYPAVMWVVADDNIETNPGETTGQGGYMCQQHWDKFPHVCKVLAIERDLSHNEEMCLYALHYLALSG